MFRHIFKTGYFLFISALFVLSSCSTKPQPIQFGVDNCDFCKMTISDQRYGAELVTKKGRIFKFDDIHCIKGFIENEQVKDEDIAGLWLVDFSNPQKLIPAKHSYLFFSEQLKSPMGSNIAAFENTQEKTKIQENYSGTEMKWDDYLAQHH
ncbi:nitrous-oxide reductase accessory protein NosL [Pseudopedobacter saltans DSM 12145]|uniref:Nitrous-oxide reductase accessory protein NosL n=1 Tax=Pseudopedobacter saltans (strain ATCC 51119 / DSM 12145 / JCM 21818 / CCUG 39354 / LMG 10337 / NBRC 100064 / NCIMB 13643) TaxID=762903 RepID=F0S500_PSESL|nr:nitrous oxide reductase accessory protein NosL [Pseudopedobacter saltans]ADY54174.1 nitrous-oxide reductase accessory protein NosL [Pseudopedobacter saltans DSM 12145]